MSTSISLCIPRVFNNITEAKIRDVFNKINFGNIYSIDIIQQTNKKVTVKRLFYNGKQYLKSGENVLYDPDTKEEVGIWCEETQTILDLPDDFYEDEDDDDDDEN